MKQSLQSWSHNTCNCLYWAYIRRDLTTVSHGLRKGSVDPISPCWSTGFFLWIQRETESLPAFSYVSPDESSCLQWMVPNPCSHRQPWISSEITKQNKTKAMNVREGLVKRRESFSELYRGEGRMRATRIHRSHVCHCQSTKLIKFWKWRCS